MVLPNLSYAQLEQMVSEETQTRQRSMIATTAALLILCYIAIILRLIARSIQGLRLAWNDYIIIFALAVVTGMGGVILYAVKLGLGLHIILVGATKGFQVAKMLYVVEVLFPLGNHSVKISILLLYRAIFGKTRQRWFNVGLKTLIVLWLLCTFTSSLFIVFQCVPVSYAWTTDHSERCLNLEQMIMGFTVWSVILNFGTLILPMPIIWELQLSRKIKIGIAALFVLGGADVVICIIRAVETKQIDPTLVDFTWLQAPSTLLGLMEITIGIICACIPTLRPIYRKLRSGISSMGSSKQSSHATPQMKKTVWNAHTPWRVVVKRDLDTSTSQTYVFEDGSNFDMSSIPPGKLPSYSCYATPGHDGADVKATSLDGGREREKKEHKQTQSSSSSRQWYHNWAQPPAYHERDSSNSGRSGVNDMIRSHGSSPQLSSISRS